MEYFVLTNRSVISIAGVDKKIFLQGIISNNVDKISPTSLTYALLLTPQGKIITDFFITESNDIYLLDCPKHNFEQVLKKLTMYKLRSNIEIKDCSNEYQLFASFNKINNFFHPDPRDARLGYRAILEKNFQITGKVQDPSQFETKRMELLIPDMIIDLKPESFFPLELHLDELNAIDYNKGCYIGQEVTARTHHRGVVRKKIYQAEVINGTPPSPQNDILFDGKKIGETLGFIGSRGLCLMRIEDIENLKEQIFKVVDSEIKIIY